MKRFLVLLMFISMGSLACVKAQECSLPTTVVLVRHAEKALDQGNDPELTEAGKVRATRLATYLDNADVAGLYATQFKRTQATLLDLSTKRNLPVQVMEVQSSNWNTFAEALRRHIQAHYCGKTVAVAQHSNTIPQLINTWVGTKMKDIDDADYENIFVLTLRPGNTASLIRARF